MEQQHIPGLEIVAAKHTALPEGSVEETAKKLREEHHTNGVTGSVQVHGDGVVASI